MALLDIWKSSEADLQKKSVQQIIAIAGDGALKDDGSCSVEFREFLSYVPSSLLKVYCNQCLEDKFDGSGLVLQDIVNQIGIRLGYRVSYGRYRGQQGKVGFDGIWEDSEDHALVVEVKTTDAYSIDLDSVARYRSKLSEESRIGRESSILFVVGRQETKNLEAQIRGSRHAWDVRVISVKALHRLLDLKEDTEDPGFHKRISGLLVPEEYTRVDGIIDLVFAAATDVQQADEIRGGESQESIANEKSSDRQKKQAHASFHEGCVAAVERRLGISLVKRSRSTYSSVSETSSVMILVSREYSDRAKTGYWFAFHPSQKERLAATKDSFVAFGLGSPDRILLVPFAEVVQWLDKLNRTELEDRYYWHVQIHEEKGSLVLQPKKGFDKLDLTKFLIGK